MGINRFCVGVEEIAFALQLTNQKEAAITLITGNFGNLDEKEHRGRLLAASHSLMARGFVKLKANKPSLLPEVSELVSSIVKNDFYFRFNKSFGTSEEIFTCYFSKNKIVSHEITQGVVHELNLVKDTEEIVKALSVFYDFKKLEHVENFRSDFPNSKLEKVKETAQKDPKNLLPMIKELRIPEKAINPFAEDLKSTEYRATGLRIDYRKDQLESNKGFLLLKGAKRMWFFNIYEKDKIPFITMMPANEDNLRYLISAML